MGRSPVETGPPLEWRTALRRGAATPARAETRISALPEALVNLPSRLLVRLLEVVVGERLLWLRSNVSRLPSQPQWHWRDEHYPLRYARDSGVLRSLLLPVNRGRGVTCGVPHCSSC